jgi:hypothetical protein
VSPWIAALVLFTVLNVGAALGYVAGLKEGLDRNYADAEDLAQLAASVSANRDDYVPLAILEAFALMLGLERAPDEDVEGFIDRVAAALRQPAPFGHPDHDELAEERFLGGRCVCDHPGSPPAAPDCPIHGHYSPQFPEA